MTFLLAALGSTAFRGFVAMLISVGAITLKSKVGIELSSADELALTGLVMGYLAKLGHENHLDAKAAGDAAAATVTTPAQAAAVLGEVKP